jgi:FkbM family methyltransferase
LVPGPHRQSQLIHQSILKVRRALVESGFLAMRVKRFVSLSLSICLTLSIFWSLMATWPFQASPNKVSVETSFSQSPRHESATHQEDDVPIQRLVQIGANDGSNSANDDIVRNLLADDNTYALLVEPNPQVFDMLKSNIATMYNNTARITPMNALVCPKGADLTFFVVNEKLGEDYPDAPHWVRYQLSSLKRESVAKGLQGFLNQMRRSQEFKGSRAPAYIKDVTISCTPFLSVLEQGGFAPQDVDVLAVDTEGYDAKVVTSALIVPGFLPKTIIFEAKGLPADERNALLDMLEGRGYTTDCPKVGSVRRKTCPRDDVVATL